mgnify:CR=1 FL=1
MVKFFKIIEKIVYGIAALAIVAALAMMIIGAFVNLDKVEKELLSYMPYFYICATKLRKECNLLEMSIG